MLQRIFDVLDNRWVNRAGNAVFLASVTIFIGTRVFAALQHVDWLEVVAYAGITLGLMLMLLERIGKQRSSPQAEVDGSRLWATVFGEEQKEREKRARQIAKDNIDREAKR